MSKSTWWRPSLVKFDLNGMIGVFRNSYTFIECAHKTDQTCAMIAYSSCYGSRNKRTLAQSKYASVNTDPFSHLRTQKIVSCW